MACVAIHAVAARAVAAQAVAHGTAADGVFPPVSPLALQRATSSRVVAAEEAADEDVVALVAAVDDELKLEANSVGDQLRYKSTDAVNTAKFVDAQCESANDVQSKEDEANVEPVEAKEVATGSLGRSIVLGKAKSLHQANDEARMEALEDPIAIGVVFSPSRPLGVSDNHPESNYLMALGEEVSNNRHISGVF